MVALLQRIVRPCDGNERSTVLKRLARPFGSSGSPTPLSSIRPSPGVRVCLVPPQCPVDLICPFPVVVRFECQIFHVRVPSSIL